MGVSAGGGGGVVVCATLARVDSKAGTPSRKGRASDFIRKRVWFGARLGRRRSGGDEIEIGRGAKPGIGEHVHQRERSVDESGLQMELAELTEAGVTARAEARRPQSRQRVAPRTLCQSSVRSVSQMNAH